MTNFTDTFTLVIYYLYICYVRNREVSKEGITTKLPGEFNLLYKQFILGFFFLQIIWIVDTW